MEPKPYTIPSIYHRYRVEIKNTNPIQSFRRLEEAIDRAKKLAEKHPEENLSISVDIEGTGMYVELP